MLLRESPERGSADPLERLTSKSNVCTIAMDLIKRHHCSMTILDIDDHNIDEALWAAYRCSDKNAVTENLLRRYLPELTFIPNVNGARDEVRDYFRNATTSERIEAAACART